MHSGEIRTIGVEQVPIFGYCNSLLSCQEMKGSWSNNLLHNFRLLIIDGGRLGEYKYYDMDQVIAAALELSSKILK